MQDRPSELLKGSEGYPCPCTHIHPASASLAGKMLARHKMHRWVLDTTDGCSRWRGAVNPDMNRTVAGGFLDAASWRDLWEWVARLGGLASLVGLPLVFNESRRARESARNASTTAEAARLASKSAVEELHRQVLLTDMTHTADLLAEALTLLRTKNTGVALARISDVSRELSQLRHLERFREASIQVRFQKVISQLAVLQEDLDGDPALDVARCSHTLRSVSNQLDEWIGQEKYSRKEDR